MKIKSILSICAILIGVSFLFKQPSVQGADTAVPATRAVKFDLKRGEKLYKTTCFACHGFDGRGMVPGTPNFTSKRKGSLQKTDKVLAKHIWEGYQSPGSPLAMPPKGGNPNLTKEDIDHLLAYIRKSFGPK